MKEKKIAIIGTVGIPAKYGGFETLAEYLTKYLGESLDITVFCSAKSYDTQLSTYNNAKLIYLKFQANGVQSILYDIVSMIKAINFDNILILGVSGCVFLPILKKISKAKIIVNIDGLEWKRAKWNKVAKWFLKLSEKLAVKYADIVITDNKVIEDYVKMEYKKDSVLIAYGADHVKKLELSEKLLAQFNFLSTTYAFTVCRIEPENNLHIIVEALAKQQSLPLVIVGNWNSSQYGVELKKRYSHLEHIHLLDSIYEQQILNQIRSNCFIYLHGHSAGGTNPSLIEAMFLGLPIFAYAVDYNRETTEHSAQYFSTANELFNLINQVDNNALHSVGQKMSDIANKRYKWCVISEQYAHLFES